MLDYPEPSYASANGIELAHEVFGCDGGPTVVWAKALGPNLDALSDLPGLWIERIAGFARVLAFDRRGEGLSTRTFGFGTVEDRMDDIGVVMDAAEVERAVLLADHDSVCLALLFAATYPTRVTGLVLASVSGPRVLWAPDYPIGLPVEAMDRYVSWVGRTWGTGRVLAGFGPGASVEELKQSARRERGICTPAMAAEHFRRAVDMDVRDALPAVQAPTLIIHGVDEVLPIAWARYLAARLGDATLVEGQGWGLGGPVAAPLFDAIEEFITGERPGRLVDADRVLATVLLVDIATSTRHLVELGDRRWSELIIEFRRQIRIELERHRGREVNYRGDDVLATFDGSTRAVRCAQAIATRARSLGVEVRAGAHTGEIELQGGDVAGIAVHTCARVCALATPGEVLVTSTLRELVAGSELEFEPRGSHELTGIPGAFQLFAVVP